jgi:hypothetical protein
MPIDRLWPGTARAAAFPAEWRAVEYAGLARVAADVSEPQLRAGMGVFFPRDDPDAIGPAGQAGQASELGDPGG